MPEQNIIAAEAITEQKSSIENCSADRNAVIDFLYASCVKASQNIEKNRNRQHIHKVKVKVKENHTAADNFELQAAIAEIFRKHSEFIKEVFHYLYSVEYAKSLGESEYEFFVKDRAHQILKTAYESADSEIWKL